MTRFAKRRLLVTIAVLASISTMPATAAVTPTNVDIKPGGSYSPKLVTIPVGNDVQWTNTGDKPRSLISNSKQPGSFAVWSVPPGGVSSPIDFNYAGTWRYRSDDAKRTNGAIGATVSASDPNPGVGEDFVVSWAAVAAGPYVFDIQVKNPGERSYEPFLTRTNALNAHVSFGVPGIYRLRARTLDLGVGKKTDYSPPIEVTVS